MKKKNKRMGFIGGSDAKQIMDGNWHDLWLIKTGRKEPDDLSDILPVQLGIVTEDFNRDWFSLKLNLKTLDDITYNRTYESIPCKGHLDGIVFELDNPTPQLQIMDDYQVTSVVECKHTFQNNTLSKVIEQYMPQLQFYMFCTHNYKFETGTYDNTNALNHFPLGTNVYNLKEAYLSVLFGNQRWEYAKIDYHSEYIDKMLVHIKEFWDCVINDKEPADKVIIDKPNIDTISIDDMIRVDMNSDNMFIDRAHTYINTKKQHDLHTNAKKDLLAMVDENCRDAYSDLISIRRQPSGRRQFVIHKEETNESNED